MRLVIFEWPPMLHFPFPKELIFDRWFLFWKQFRCSMEQAEKSAARPPASAAGSLSCPSSVNALRIP